LNRCRYAQALLVKRSPLPSTALSEVSAWLQATFIPETPYTRGKTFWPSTLASQMIASRDEADAQFMLGACASFVSYLIAKGIQAGLLEPK